MMDCYDLSGKETPIKRKEGVMTDEEKGKLFMELMEKRRKHFAALKAQEKRNIPPTKAQKRTQMSTYLNVTWVREMSHREVKEDDEAEQKKSIGD
ncbi:hypothetical protein Tco_1524242 [Tanacetum coccineum]